MSNRESNMPQPPAAKQETVLKPEPPMIEPQVDSSPQPPAGEVAVPKVHTGIEVVAIGRGGFIYNQRRFPGDSFVVRSEKELGTWMRCKDPKMEMKHQENMADKKARIKKFEKAGN